MSNLRQRGALLEENIKLKKEKEELNDKVDRLLSDINTKLGEMSKALQELKDRPSTVVVQQNGSKIDGKIIEIKETEKSPTFIPSADTSGMKMNASPVEKKKRKTDLSGAADALTKLQKNK